MEGTGPLGVVVVGLGDVGASLITGALASRAHLVHPFGSLVEGGGTGRTEASGLSRLRDQAPFAELGDLVFGAFEVHDDDAYRAALRTGIVNRSLVDELRPELRKIRAMLGGRQAPTRRHLADALAEDLRGFLAHHHCSSGVVVCTLPGARAPAAKPAFTADEVRAALEESADWVTAGAVYAAAAAETGCAFVAAGRDAALGAPGIPALFEERSLPIAGTGLLGPDALLREMLAQVLTLEGMQLAGAASLSTRAEERGEHLLARAGDPVLMVDLVWRAGRSGAKGWMDALFAKPLRSATQKQATAETLLEQRARLLAELPALARSIGREAA